MADLTASWWSSLSQLITTFSSRNSPRTSKPSSWVMLPPASPTATANRPSEPGVLSRRTRRWSEKAAVGVPMASTYGAPTVGRERKGPATATMAGRWGVERITPWG